MYIIFFIAAAGLGGGVLGWRAWVTGTTDLDDYIDVSEAPPEVSNRRYRHNVRQERKRRRLTRTVLWTLAGALAGVLAVFAFALYRRR